MALSVSLLRPCGGGGLGRMRYRAPLTTTPTALAPHLCILLQGTGRIKWSAVAAQIEGRTDKQCAIRYKAIKSG